MERLACYSSGNESDEDYFNGETVNSNHKHEEEEIQHPSSFSSLEKTSGLSKETGSFFFSTGDNEDSSDSDDDDVVTKTLGRKRKPEESATELDEQFESKIFDNDYSREEKMNTNLLSKHVTLSNKPTSSVKKSKFTCKAYLKGKCRFGDRCRFSHPVHDRKSDQVEDVSISSNPTFYSESAEAQVFHSKRFKSSAEK